MLPGDALDSKAFDLDDVHEHLAEPLLRGAEMASTTVGAGVECHRPA
ncbi:hypothetical protein SAMN04487916_104124 [Arthrobacter sp. ov407]|nr:hypothetical protein SAMN04487916_104124 [Arthrobacter sp. ov407]